MRKFVPRRFLMLPLGLFLSFSWACASSVPQAHDILVRRDALRDRTWALRADALYLYESRTGTRARRFTLPGWIYVTPRFACEPDLLVEATGTVIVSSNIVPNLWRVDPDASTTVELQLVLEPEAGRDLGFTALRFATHGALHAGGSTDRSRWQIDLLNLKAIRLESAVASAPGLACE
jgi:hypothetical protein